MSQGCCPYEGEDTAKQKANYLAGAECCHRCVCGCTGLGHTVMLGGGAGKGQSPRGRNWYPFDFCEFH